MYKRSMRITHKITHKEKQKNQIALSEDADKKRRESGTSTCTIDSGYSGSSSTMTNISTVIESGRTNVGAGIIVHMHGILLKKPFGHQSNKWSKRFFIIKEGFMFYYAESEKKAFESKPIFNIHPKGVIPLGYCQIEESSQPGVSFAISIQHPNFKSPIVLAAESAQSQMEWIKAMDRATMITLENSQLGESMIRSLQDQSLQLARERQEYIGAEELGVEREQREALELFNQELSEENERVEVLVDELQKAELDDAMNSSLQLDEDREKLKAMTNNVEQSLADLSSQRSTIICQLQNPTSMKVKTEQKSSALTEQLAEIESRAKLLESEKLEISQRLDENIVRSRDLERDRETLANEACELRNEIQELNVEKQITEEELKEEIVSRMKLQQELELCKGALKRLEKQALRNTETIANSNSESTQQCNTSPEEHDVSSERENEQSNGINGNISKSAETEQIRADVKSLRAFFESCASDDKSEVEVGKCGTIRHLRGISTKRKSVKAQSKPAQDNSLSVNGNSAENTVTPVITKRVARSTIRRTSAVAQEATNLLLRNPDFRRSFAGVMTLQNRFNPTIRPTQDE